VDSWELADDDATARAGARLAALLAPGDAIALIGELGAGKTALVRAAVEALGSSDGAVSPTFALVSSYRGGRLPVAHVDLYRVEHERELAELGLDELLGDGVLFVEWADRFDVMPSDHLRIELEHAGAGRRLRATGRGVRGAQLAAAWAAALAASVR
jgi:tRNA threonylcarbamoyladenosine biosynthesis protein TsaE